MTLIWHPYPYPYSLAGYQMGKIKKTELKFYQESDWKKVKTFLHNNWRKNHPICRKELFDWQHKGFGYKKGEVNSLLLLHNDEVVGFRGVIPGLYQVPLKGKKMKIIKGGSSPMWMVKENFRGIPSFKMYLKTLQMFPVLTAAGINIKTSMKFHQRNNYIILNAIHRYIFPLNDRMYQKILSKNADFQQIKNWAKKLSKADNNIINPVSPDINKIAELWEKITFSQQIFSLYRNAEFWKWRYIDSKGFKYLFFGDPEYNGTIIARVEKIITNDLKGLEGRKVFRIIEILPGNALVQDQKSNEKLSEMIRGVLNWAVSQDCLMADFQCSSKRFERLLNSIGFKEQNTNMQEPICSVPSLFQPLRYNFPPINMAFRINIPGEADINFSWSDTYMVKSESDQDRPNL